MQNRCQLAWRTRRLVSECSIAKAAPISPKVFGSSESIVMFLSEHNARNSAPNDSAAILLDRPTTTMTLELRWDCSKIVVEEDADTEVSRLGVDSWRKVIRFIALARSWSSLRVNRSQRRLSAVSDARRVWVSLTPYMVSGKTV